MNWAVKLVLLLVCLFATAGGPTPVPSARLSRNTGQERRWSVVQERGYGLARKPCATHAPLRMTRAVIEPD